MCHGQTSLSTAAHGINFYFHGIRAICGVRRYGSRATCGDIENLMPFGTMIIGISTGKILIDFLGRDTFYFPKVLNYLVIWVIIQ